MDLSEELKNIEDHLFRHFQMDIWDRAIYYHVLRETRLEQRSEHLFAIKGMADVLGLGHTKVRDVVRALDAKGCLKIVDRSRNGHLLRVVLPSEIEGLIPTAEEATEVDLGSLDFYSDRRFLSALLDREDLRCFYCLRDVSSETCVLDHVVPAATAGDNSYMNIVIACHDCNAKKGEQVASDFLRSLYRRSLLTEAEFDTRLAALERLGRGELKPRAELCAV